jgi:membrane protease YdiL (CAAX protease family)
MGNLYHAAMQPVFVLGARASPGAEPEVVLPADLAQRGKPVAATTRVAIRRAGPFAPIADALEEDARLRDLFAEGLDLDVARRWKTLRFTLMLGLVPLGLLAEVDRELWLAHAPSALARLVGDLFVMGAVVHDLARRTPHHPRTTAVVLFAAALRFALFVAKGCGVAHFVAYAGLAAALASAVAVAVLAPTPERVIAATLARLGVSAADVRAMRAAALPSAMLVASAIAAAAALPMVLALMRVAKLGTLAQAIAFAVFGLVVPLAIEHAFDRVNRIRRSAWRVASAVVLGLALAVGLGGVARHAIDASTNVARCVAPESAFARSARGLVEAQNEELSRAPEPGSKVPLVALNVLLVPLVEERVYRGLLQRVLAARFGRARGLAAAALLFGLAHVGVYKVALYQTTILGVSFGAAFAAGGLAASVIVHAVWNFVQSM